MNLSPGLAAIRKIKLRQCSRLTWIRAGDGNTKLFHLWANARRRKNCTPVLHHNQRTCTTHEVHGHYTETLGANTQRECTVNWESIQMVRHDLSDLDREVTGAGTHAAVL
jgi:hypothetical protein